MDKSAYALIVTKNHRLKIPLKSIDDMWRASEFFIKWANEQEEFAKKHKSYLKRKNKD